MDGREYLKTIPELARLLKGADHLDVKTVRSQKSLREFLAAMFNYQPGWVSFLFGMRKFLAGLLGLRQNGIPRRATLRPENISFRPGAKLSFFKVEQGQEDSFIVAGIDDSHLWAGLVVAVEPGDGPSHLYHVATIVKYHRWTGPVYFNLIRPFHHLVVGGMARAGSH